MPDTDPNEFTDREKFLLSYYRYRESSGPRRFFRAEIIIMIASLTCIVAASIQEDIALGFVAYALVLGRLIYMSAEGGKWSKDFQNIFRKYDAKLKAMNDKEAAK